MFFQGKVRGFSTYTKEMLEQMRQDLSLSLSADQLLHCVTYYKTAQKRDPFIEELQMIDRLVANKAASPANAATVEFLTNDSLGAQTYSDLLRKRRALKPDVKYPMTIAEAFETVDGYLNRVGKRNDTDTIFLLEDPALRPFSATRNCVCVSDTGLRLRAVPKSKLPCKEGDLLVLLIPRTDSYADRQGASVGNFLQDKTANGTIKQILTVGAGGLLEVLLNLTEGARIEPQRLSLAGEAVPLTALSGSYLGDYVLRVEPARFEVLYRDAAACGVSTRVFASITKGGAYTFSGSDFSFSLASDFLRSLFPILPITAALADAKEHNPKTEILHTPTSASFCSYLQRENGQAQTYAVEDRLYAAAYSAPVESCFQAALDTALIPVMTLAAAGVHYVDQQLAIGLELPMGDDRYIVGNTLSTILGVYRLQSELAIPAVSKTVAYKEGIDRPHLTVYAIGKQAPTATTKLTKEGNAVYCITPDRHDDGTVDFASLRDLLRSVAALRQKGILQSARILCNESVTEGLRHLSTDRLFCRLTSDIFASEEPLSLAFLLETTQPITAKRVGTVTQRDTVSTPLTSESLAIGPSLIWSPKPSVVIVAKKTDIAAQILCSHLLERGANARLFSDEEKDANRLSRALLGAQTLILCSKAKLAETERLQFAAEVFAKAGGTTLLVGGAKIDKIADAIAQPNGIPADTVALICKKKQ
ncbi:MAG: hypothetical protein IJF33_05855 [Clostridia bacterium]|nr:hypothetical protein [Clostridia bacterium]